MTMEKTTINNQEQIYIVTFGKEYGVSNDSIFYDKLYLLDNNSHGFGTPVPVYASFEDGKLLELATKMEIPIIKRSAIPGFGAYKLNPVYTIEDYQSLAFYLSLVTGEKNVAFQRAIKDMIEYLEKIKNKYLMEHIDEFGSLSSESEEREVSFQKRYDSYIQMIKKFRNEDNLPK